MSETVLFDAFDSSEDNTLDFYDTIRGIPGDWFIVGDLGLWNGKRHVWAWCNSLYYAIQKCDQFLGYIRVVEDTHGKLMVYEYHHDGTNVFEVRRCKPDAYLRCHTEKAFMRNSKNAHIAEFWR